MPKPCTPFAAPAPVPMLLSRFRQLLTALIAATCALGAQASINITLQFDGSLSASEQAYFTAAETYWESVLTGYQPGVSISGILIDARKVNIDGSGRTLASAGLDEVRLYGSYYLPTRGNMSFDSSDINGMISNGSFTSVIMHEMAHVLGFGTLWYPDPSLGRPGGQNVYATGSGQYTGANALAAYRVEFNQPGATYVPVELGGGSGTADAHWNEGDGGSAVGIVDGLGRDMRFELMTGWINNPTFVSQTTLASFVDIGYSITAVPEPAALLLFVAGLPLLRRATGRRAVH